MTIQATITALNGTVTTYIFEPHPGRLVEANNFYRDLYQAGEIADYQVIAV
jgi:hypothetical protein